MVSNIWALHEMAKTFRRDEGDRLLFPMHAVRLLCLAQKDRASDDAKSWMKGLDGQGRWDEIKPTIPDYAYDKHTSQGQAMVRRTESRASLSARTQPTLVGNPAAHAC